MISKIIHQIAPSDKKMWHPFWIKCHESWKQNFSNYKIVIWNDQQDIDNLVKENYPHYWNLYQAFPVHIMKIDFVRLCILHKYGGVYADMDMFCYNNFEKHMTKEVYFLENTTKEYTSAEFENSMMACSPGHRLMEELMRYTQTCFIHFRNQLVKKTDHWRTPSNDMIINNTTGSGMISKAIEILRGYFDIGVFDCEKFNNRPMSYSNKFYTKHVHTSVWGNEYTDFVKNKLDRLIIIDGCAYSAGDMAEDAINKIKNNNKTFQVVFNQDFNFYYDYTNGNYLKEDNLDLIQKIVSRKHL